MNVTDQLKTAVSFEILKYARAASLGKDEASVTYYENVTNEDGDEVTEFLVVVRREGNALVITVNQADEVA